MPALITLENFKSHARIYHESDDGYIQDLLLPAAIAAWERATGVAAFGAEHTATVSEEGELPFYPYPQPIKNQKYTPNLGTPEDPDVHYEGERQVLIIPEDADRPVTITWETDEQSEAVLPVLELATRLYADRGDSTAAIEGKAQQMLVALMHERGVV